MRITLRFGPLLAALLALLLTGAAQAKKETKEVDGFGVSLDGAEQDALERACEWVIAKLRERRPRLEKLPSAETLRKAELTRRVQHQPNHQSEEFGTLHRVTLRVEVGEADLQKMLRADQNQRVRERQAWTGKVLLLVVALLGALGLFFRLEEATRGYYSGPLKAGLVLAGIAIVAGAFVLW